MPRKKTKWVFAQFIGEDGSLGYRKKRIYKLKLTEGSNTIVSDDKLTQPCPYESIYSFFKNWKPI